MKNYLLLIVSCSLFFACSHKTIPAKTNNATVITGNNTTANTAPNETISTDTASAVNNTNELAFMVIANAYGKIINQQNNLPPDANVHFDALELSKGFSAQQLANLKARYKTIPPRVLYVNPKNQQNSARGTYYILGKKFWYWKKKNGFFYLDDKYYL